MQRLDRGEYLHAIDRLERLASEPRAGDDSARQTFLQARPMIEYVAPPPVDPRQPGLPQAQSARLRRAVPQDALDAIAAAAAGARIVILNEAHQSPRDRAFGLTLARRLRPLGYDVLAAEAFANDGVSIGPLARDGVPRLRSGYYLKEPVFADFVRQASSARRRSSTNRRRTSG